jgi:hypothetical protein
MANGKRAFSWQKQRYGAPLPLVFQSPTHPRAGSTAPVEKCRRPGKILGNTGGAWLLVIDRICIAARIATAQASGFEGFAAPAFTVWMEGLLRRVYRFGLEIG